MTPISLQQALHLLAEVFDAPLSDLTPGTAREAIAGWDSMGALSLMAEFDERFGIELTPEVSRGMSKVGDVLALLEQHGALVS